VSPLKFFEYLATGKPIVATPLASILRYGEVACLAPDFDSFIEGIEKALANPEASRSVRLALAAKQTWNQRIEEISRILGE